MFHSDSAAKPEPFGLKFSTLGICLRLNFFWKVSDQTSPGNSKKAAWEKYSFPSVKKKCIKKLNQLTTLVVKPQCLCCSEQGLSIWLSARCVEDMASSPL